MDFCWVRFVDLVEELREFYPKNSQALWRSHARDAIQLGLHCGLISDYDYAPSSRHPLVTNDHRRSNWVESYLLPADPGRREVLEACVAARKLILGRHP